MTIIEKMHKELRDNVVITHRITEKYLGNEENQTVAGSFDEINVDEEFKIKFTVKNKNSVSVDLTEMILRGTDYAEVVGSNTDERVIEIKKGNQWESEEYTMLAIKNFGPFGAQPIVHVELKMRITTDELNYFDKEEAESELIYPKVPELQHNK